VGAGWLAPALAVSGGDRLQRVAQRLPRPLGEALSAAADQAIDSGVLSVAMTLLAKGAV
jgi:hypothetical protein